MSLGENLKMLMAQNCYTQKVLAVKSYCTEAAISRYIHNERKPNYKTLKNLAAALGVSVDALTSKKLKEDAVKVVRCKDCKYLTAGVCIMGVFGVGYTKPKANHYCSYGERRAVQGE